MSVDLHLYYSPYCPHCRGAGAVVAEAARSVGLADAVQERNVLEHIEAAVAAGIRQTPALTLNGRLVAAGRLEAAALAACLEQMLSEEST